MDIDRTRNGIRKIRCTGIIGVFYLDLLLGSKMYKLCDLLHPFKTPTDMQEDEADALVVHMP